VLIIRPSALGDVCRTVPVLVTLRRAFPWPGTSIDWLVQDTFAAAISSHPDLTGVVSFPRTALSNWRRPATLRVIRDYLRSLRRARYDLVLDCQGLARSGLLAAATGARRRIGLADAAELGWAGINEHVHGVNDAHTVDRMLSLAQVATGGAPIARDMRLYTAPEDRAYVSQSLGLTPESFVLLAPTSRWPGKLWPEERFVELARRTLNDRSLGVERIAFVGAASERSQCKQLESAAAADGRIVSLLGRTTVGQLMAVVESSRLVVASDSAALHMAVGFDRPLIGLFGPTRVDRVGPYGREPDVIQHTRPGDKLDHKNAAVGRALMERISTDEVFDRAALLLSKPVSAPACLVP
jgi:lipopolysaccharide heptosyltransferase I